MTTLGPGYQVGQPATGWMNTGRSPEQNALLGAIFQHNQNPSAETERALAAAQKQIADANSGNSAPNNSDYVVGDANSLYQANKTRLINEQQGRELNSGPKQPRKAAPPRPTYEGTWLDPDQNNKQERPPKQGKGQNSGLLNWWKDAADAVDTKGRNGSQTPNASSEPAEKKEKWRLPLPKKLRERREQIERGEGGEYNQFSNEDLRNKVSNDVSNVWNGIKKSAWDNSIQNPNRGLAPIAEAPVTMTGASATGAIPSLSDEYEEGRDMLEGNNWINSPASIPTPDVAPGQPAPTGGAVPGQQAQGDPVGVTQAQQMDPFMGGPLQQEQAAMQQQVQMAAVYDQARLAQQAAYKDRLNPFGAGSGYEELQRPRKR